MSRPQGHHTRQSLCEVLPRVGSHLDTATMPRSRGQQPEDVGSPTLQMPLMGASFDGESGLPRSSLMGRTSILLCCVCVCVGLVGSCLAHVCCAPLCAVIKTETMGEKSGFNATFYRRIGRMFAIGFRSPISGMVSLVALNRLRDVTVFPSHHRCGCCSLAYSLLSPFSTWRCTSAWPSH